jgi:molybdopterin/thiamine biosynthesis adenylyltransferase
MRYQRNQLYINKELQNRIKKMPILIAGIGLGSVIAETALRLGFENLTIIDGDKVEQSNLNRQNFTQNNVGQYKTDALQKRLTEINPNAKIKSVTVFLTANNIETYLENIAIAINTLDFDTEAPFLLDEKCNNLNIPVIHPYNLGWAACAFVVNAQSMQLAELKGKNNKTELAVVDFILVNLPKNAPNINWLRQVAKEYNKSSLQSPPQLAIASQLVAALTTTLIFKIANNIVVETFPYSYFLSAWF